MKIQLRRIDKAKKFLICIDKSCSPRAELEHIEDER